MNQVLKKEDKLRYKGGFFKNKKGSLVLTTSELYFLAKDKKIFSIPVHDITSVNAQKGRANGVDHLYVLYNQDGKEKKVKIEHFSFLSSGMGLASRITLYFTSWEQIINDTRFGRNSHSAGALDNLEKLAELRQKGVITDEEFTAKKKQLLGL
jgi:hypothetical protein